MQKRVGIATLVKDNVMSFQQRVFFSLLKTVGLLMSVLFGLWWFNPNHIPINFNGWLHIADFILFLVVSYVIWHQIIAEILSWMMAKDMKQAVPMRPRYGQRVAFLTAFVPGKEPYDILENTLSAMVAAKYPHDTWLLDEGDDKIVKQICRRLGVRHFSRKGIKKYNTEAGIYKAKTKGGNHNAWHDKHGHKYDIVAQIDVDFVPRKDFLTKSLGYFKDPKVAFVGTPQIYGNTEESWIAQGAAEQAYGFYGTTQKGLFGKDMHLLIGANHIIRVKALNDIGGYPGHIVEDHLAGMHLCAKRWKAVYIPQKLAIGEGPATWESYFSQQMRWAYGLMDIFFKHSPKLLPKMKRKHAINYYFLQQHYFYGLVQVLGISLITLFFLFGVRATNMALEPMLMLYLPLIIWQFVISLWLQQFSIDPKTESGLLLKGRLLTIAAWPIYFMAFLGIVTGRRLTYAVTPKGDQQDERTSLALFLPHVIIGSITAIDVILAIKTPHHAPMLLFWAIVNTVIMYGFVVYVASQKLTAYFASHPLTFPQFSTVKARFSR